MVLLEPTFLLLEPRELSGQTSVGSSPLWRGLSHGVDFTGVFGVPWGARCWEKRSPSLWDVKPYIGNMAVCTWRVAKGAWRGSLSLLLDN